VSHRNASFDPACRRIRLKEIFSPASRFFFVERENAAERKSYRTPGWRQPPPDEDLQPGFIVADKGGVVAELQAQGYPCLRKRRTCSFSPYSEFAEGLASQ
jgi:hypothetical protein